MKKNVITEFVDWYILNKEGQSANYLANFFKGERDIFINNLTEYAIEYAISFKTNPFLIDK